MPRLFTPLPWRWQTCARWIAVTLTMPRHRRLVGTGLVFIGLACTRAVSEDPESPQGARPLLCEPTAGRTLIRFDPEFFERQSRCSVLLRAEARESQLVVRDPGNDDVLAVGALPEPCRHPVACDWRATASALGPLLLATIPDQSGEYPQRAWLGWIDKGYVRTVELTAGEQGFHDASTTGTRFALEPWICGQQLGLFARPGMAEDSLDLAQELRIRQGLYAADGKGWYILPTAKPPKGCEAIDNLGLP